MAESCRILRINPGLTPEEMGRATLDLLRHAGLQRPLHPAPGLQGRGWPWASASAPSPTPSRLLRALGAYHAAQEPLAAAARPGFRPDDNALPVRAKVTGAYINACLGVRRRISTGSTRRFSLTADGHVPRRHPRTCSWSARAPGHAAGFRGDPGGRHPQHGHRPGPGNGNEVEERKIDRTELYTGRGTVPHRDRRGVRAIGMWITGPSAAAARARSRVTSGRPTRRPSAAGIRATGSWLTPVFSAAPAPAQS